MTTIAMTWSDLGTAHISFTTDYGTNWTADDVFTDASPVTGFPIVNVGQGLLILAPNGTLIYFYVYAEGGGTLKKTSTDGGKTWSAASALSVSGISAGEMINTFATDHAFVYNGVIYVSCIHYYDANYDVLIKSTDNGVTWTYLSRIGGAGLTTGEAGIVYLGSDHILAMLRMSNPGNPTIMKITHSYDMGLTWSTPVVFPGFSLGGRLHLWTRKQLKGEANWWTDTVLIMSGFIYPYGDQRQNSMWVSLDSGVTWQPRATLDDVMTVDTGGYGDTFWNPNTSEYVTVQAHGSEVSSEIKQYNVAITGI
jgi:hypothetical protein